MNRHFRNFVAVLAAGAALGLPLSASRVAAADRVPDTSGPTSQHANNLVNQHVDARVNATGERPKDTDDLTVGRRDERRDEQRDPQRDWRNAPGMDRYGWTTTGVPYWAPR